MISKEAYLRKKDRLVRQFQHAKKNGVVALNKKTSNLFRTRKKRSNQIDVKDFNNVISIDKKNLIAEVEGMTTYETFMKETIRHGLIPSVVPELKTITIGGAISGVGLETSSFRYGFVHETVLETDVLTGYGKVITCTKNNRYNDLFFGFPNTYGTLGYILRVKVKLVPVKKYVRIVRERFTDIPSLFKGLKEVILKNLHNKQVGFIEAFSFSANEHYIATVHFVDSVPYLSDYTFMNIYYKSMRKKSIDYMTTFDHIWRLDTDWFWNSKHFGMENKLLRFMLGKWMLRSTVYWKIMQLNRKIGLHKSIHKLRKIRKETIIQDVEISIDKAGDFLEWFYKELQVPPIFLCPTTVVDKKRQFTFFRLNPQKINVNIGFYSNRRTKHGPAHYNKKVEQKTRELGGQKTLYSDSFYTPEEFWKIYDKKAYSRLKKRYDPDSTFRGLYEKCVMRK